MGIGSFQLVNEPTRNASLSLGEAGYLKTTGIVFFSFCDSACAVSCVCCCCEDRWLRILIGWLESCLGEIWERERGELIRGLLVFDRLSLLVRRGVINDWFLLSRCDRGSRNDHLHRHVRTECRYHSAYDRLVVGCPWTTRSVERSDHAIEQLTRRYLWFCWVE